MRNLRTTVAVILCAGLFGNTLQQLHATPHRLNRHYVVPTESGPGGVPIVHVMIDGGGPFTFVVDTGAPGRLRLDKSVADALALKPFRYEEEGDGSAQNNFKTPVVRIGKLSLGSFAKPGLEAEVVDLKGHGFHYDGMFGMGAFADNLLTLDYAHSRLEVDNHTLPPANGKDIFNYKETADGLIEVPVSIGGKKLNAYVDTGQTMTAILVPETTGKMVAAGPPVASGTAHTIANSYTLYEVPVKGPVVVGTVALRVEKLRYPSTDASANIGSRAFAGGIVRIDQRNHRIQISYPPHA